MAGGFTASFGLLLKAARKRKKLTQRQLAERVGVHFNTLWAWERGDYLPATRGQVLELAQQLRLDAAETRILLEASLTALSPHWTVPFPRNRCFSGRGILLKTLHTRLATDPSALQTRSVAVSGLGGIGKTQLVLEYAYRHALDYSAVFWLGADTAEALLAGLHQIASVLALPEGQEADQSHLVDAVRRWLSAHRGWLLIADNVEELALLEPVLPPARAGALLLTSRLQASAGLAERLDVPPLSQEEGVALLFQRAGRARLLAEEAAAGELVTLLGGLPLALDQAGAYLEETGCSVVEYLERYAQHRHLLLGRRGTSVGAHPDSVASTVRLAVEQVESTHPAAVDLLRLCAFLQPDAIPQEMLRLGAPFLGQVLGPVVADAAELDLALVALRRTSLISRQPETQTLTLHRLVQVVLQDSFDQASRRLWSERVVQVVYAAFPAGDVATWVQCERVLPHALACVPLLEAVGHALPEAPALLGKAGSYLVERGRYAEAAPLLAQALALQEAQHGSDHPALIPLLVRRAQLLREQAQYEQAETLLHQAWRLGEQFSVSDPLSTVETLRELTILAWRRGDYAEAEHWGQRALTLGEQQTDIDAPALLTIRYYLASVWRDAGHSAEAEALFHQALVGCERVLGSTHPQTLKTLDGLATLYAQQRQYAQAEPVFERALALREQRLGQEHPHTATALNNLSAAYVEQGKYAQAEPLVQRALLIWEQQLGPEHPHTLAALINLTELAWLAGHQEQARRGYMRARALCEQHKGTDQPQIARVLAGLAQLARILGEGEQARALYRQALIICEQRLGADHPHTRQLRLEAVAVGAPREPIEQHPGTSPDLSVFAHPGNPERPSQPPSDARLMDALATVPDHRSAQGRRHSLPAVLALSTAAMLSGARSLYALAHWGRSQSPEVLQVLGFPNGKPPAFSTLHAAFRTLDTDAFETALEVWLAHRLKGESQAGARNDQRSSGLHGEHLPGVRVLARYPLATHQVLLEEWLQVSQVGKATSKRAVEHRRVQRSRSRQGR